MSDEKELDEMRCPMCGGEIVNGPGHRRKKWCSEKCRWDGYHRGIKPAEHATVRRQRVVLWIPVTLHAALHQAAEQEETTMTDLATDILTRDLLDLLDA